MRLVSEMKFGAAFASALALPLAFGICMAALSASCLPGRVVARTASDVAADLCRDYYAERVGLSWEEAGKRFCETHDDIKPFLDVLLSQKAKLDEGAVGARAKAGK